MIKSQMFVTTTDMARRRRYDKVSVKKETNLEIALEMAVACEAVKYSTTCGWRIISPMRKIAANFLGWVTPLIKQGSSHSATVGDDK